MTYPDVRPLFAADRALLLSRRVVANGPPADDQRDGERREDGHADQRDGRRRQGDRTPVGLTVGAAGGVHPLGLALLGRERARLRANDREHSDRARAEQEQARLGDTGRVLVRPSGTEALVRVMVEAETQEEATATADRLAAVVTAELG